MKGSQEEWKVGRLKSWKVRKLKGWKVARYEGWKVEGLGVIVFGGAFLLETLSFLRPFH